MTNVLRTYGKLPAVITTIGDVGKKCGCRQAGAVYLCFVAVRHRG